LRAAGAHWKSGAIVECPEENRRKVFEALQERR
jgi:hypothetical protein